jgi:hypothetical protein
VDSKISANLNFSPYKREPRKIKAPQLIDNKKMIQTENELIVDDFFRRPLATTVGKTPFVGIDTQGVGFAKQSRP